MNSRVGRGEEVQQVKSGYKKRGEKRALNDFKDAACYTVCRRQSACG